MKKHNKKRLNKKTIIIVLMCFLVSSLYLLTYFTSFSDFTSRITGNGNNLSGLSGQTITVDDLKADYYYYKGLNYTGVWENAIPTGKTTKYFEDNQLIEVKITYDGHDIDNPNMVGEVSPLSNENTNKFVYYKYYPYARDKNGTLLTDSNGNYYIHIELIDNPFSKRPIISGTEYGFNGWICNQTSDSTANVCNASTFRYDDDYYTRYLDIPVTVGNAIVIYLNASWVPADVRTNSENDTPNAFSDKTMMGTTYTRTVTETLSVDEYYWNANYYTFTYDNRVNNGSKLTRYRWYVIGNTEPSATNGTYTLVYVPYNNTSCPAGRNNYCYQYTATANGIRNNDQYTPGDSYFIVSASNYSTNRNMTGYFGNVANTTYMNHITSREVTREETLSSLADKSSAAGYFYQVSNPTTAMVNTRQYYNEDGTVCTSATSCRTAYKLIQYNDSTTKSNGHSISQVESSGGNAIVDQNKYFYLVTRDTNIFKVTGTINANAYSTSKPYTLTGYSGTSIGGTISFSTGGNRPTYYNLTAQDDLRIENIYFSGFTNTGGSNLGVGDASTTNGVVYANSQNVKLGRNISNETAGNLCANAVVGGSGSSISGGFKVMVESGHYNVYTSGTGSSGGGTINEITILGNDYDRITDKNTKLWFNLGLEGYSHGNHYPGNDSLFVSMNYIKSGTFGYNGDGTPSSDNNAGLYITARADHYINGITGAKIEGGKINTVVGGYGFSGSSSNNSTHISMTGGNVRMIYGGAGTSATYGNRIISVTGGNIEYSVLGGSNSYTGSSTDGKLTSDTLVYVGGTVTIGTSTHITAGDTLYNVESGSVFGAGGGRSGSSYTGLGTVNNSHVVINGGTILGSVYGGGNYGSTGTQLSDTSKTVVDVYDGTVTKSVFGGSKSSGFSQSGYVSSSTITINTYGGIIGNIYGGSDSAGTCYGSTNINLYDGEVTGNVYGGGKGGYTSNNDKGTYVTGNVTINVGLSAQALNEDVEDVYCAADGNPKITGNIYGGSAFGTVNGTDSNNTHTNYKTNIVVNNAEIEGSVFGGGEGNNTYTPYVKGDVQVTINNVKATSETGGVFGGNDAAGMPSGSVVVIVNGGEIYNVFGGGNKTNLTTSDVRVNGGEITNVYGGSNQSGVVTNANVDVNSGTITNVYGGNNQGTSATNTDVDIIGGTITNVYGGGKVAPTTKTDVSVSGGTITSVFGGGEAANVNNSTTVSISNGTITNVYGGSNQSGTIPTTNITASGGNIGTIYGGNNAGGTTTIDNVRVNGAHVNHVYGGGSEANATTSSVSITSSNGQITSVYGGGKSASVNNTAVNVTGGKIGSLFGGSNMLGTVNNANVTVNMTTENPSVFQNVVFNAYDVTNECDELEEEYETVVDVAVTIFNQNTTELTSFSGSVNLSDSIIYQNDANLPVTKSGDNYNYNQGSTTILPESSTTINFKLFTNQNKDDINLTSTFNASGASTLNNYINYVYGGNNAGGNTVTADVNVQNGNVGYIYGGGNAAPVDNQNVDVDSALVYYDIYGGGNQAEITGDTIVDLDNSKVLGNVFGGGNAGEVEGNTTVNVTNAYVGKSVHGGGNGTTAIVYGSSEVNIDSDTHVKKNVFGGGNAAATGDMTRNNADVTVNIVGGTIDGNVYGGANTSVVYGTTYVNIGYNAVNDSSLLIDDVYIYGTIFGGGESNASGSENYDYSFKSVKVGINILIDGSGHNVLSTEGSIFGSGNASESEGYSYITIRNYGTFNDYKHNVSIQRTDRVIIDNSAIVFSGISDSTNDYPDLFTLSRIKELKLKNNSTLFLETGANLLEKFSSLVDVNGSEVKAQVLIDDEGNATKNVDNRVYMADGKNLNIATSQDITSYGDVEGMTFFGMFKIDRYGYVETAMYDNDIENGDTISSTDHYFFTSGSYVLGAHKTNHDIEADGFYSNFCIEDTDDIIVKYIEPTPPATAFYKWIIGEPVEAYDVTISASKYITLGANILALINDYRADSTFSIVSFDDSQLNSDIELVSQNEIPRIAPNGTQADTKMALVLKNGSSGWLTSGSTTFYTDSDTPFVGTTDYVKESTTIVPSLVLYLYHSKNIKTEGNMGIATISMLITTPTDDLHDDIKRVNINVTMVRTLVTTTDYEATVTPGKQYELFANTETNISSKASFSSYFTLYNESETNPYLTGYKRSLISDYAFPENTKITMIDFLNDGTTNYYYHVITAAEEQDAINQLQTTGDINYYLSSFIKMGSTDPSNHYDDAQMSNIYYDPDLDTATEEFIFIVDFSEADIQNDVINKSLLIELQDSSGNTMISVYGSQQLLAKYNAYVNADATIDITASVDNETIYPGSSTYLSGQTTYNQYEVGGKKVYEDTYEDAKLGLKISLYDSNGNLVPGASLLGLSFTYQNETYWPRIDGTTRINVSPKVANVLARIKVNIPSSMPPDNYTVKVESFGSADGIYFGLVPSSYDEVNINVLSANHGLKIDIADEYIIINKDTGFNLNDNNIMPYRLTFNSSITNPKVKVSLYRRNYNSIYSMQYDKVDLQDYVTNTLTEQGTKEYLLTSVNTGVLNNTFTFKDNLVSGTYKLTFSLYDGNTFVGDIYKYIFIK